MLASARHYGKPGMVKWTKRKMYSLIVLISWQPYFQPGTNKSYLCVECGKWRKHYARHLQLAHKYSKGEANDAGKAASNPELKKSLPRKTPSRLARRCPFGNCGSLNRNMGQHLRDKHKIDPKNDPEVDINFKSILLHDKSPISSFRNFPKRYSTVNSA